jgi:hypothetical protein
VSVFFIIASPLLFWWMDIGFILALKGSTSVPDFFIGKEGAKVFKFVQDRRLPGFSTCRKKGEVREFCGEVRGPGQIRRILRYPMEIHQVDFLMLPICGQDPERELALIQRHHRASRALCSTPRPPVRGTDDIAAADFLL